MKILTGYRGGLLDGEIARVYNSCVKLRGLLVRGECQLAKFEGIGLSIVVLTRKTLP